MTSSETLKALESALAAKNVNAAIACIARTPEIAVGLLPGSERRPLHVAIESGLRPVILALLNNGADPNARDVYGQTALHTAIEAGNGELALMILNMGGDPFCTSYHRWTVLHYLAGRSCAIGDRVAEQLLAQLLEAGVDVNAVDDNGSSALHRVRGDGSGWFIQALCQVNADPNIRDLIGWTPLFHYIVADSPSLIATIMEWGADAEVMVGENGLTPVGYTIAMRRAACARALLEGGANPNGGTREGFSYTAAIAVSGLADWVEMFAAHGTDFNRPDSTGLTPLMVAARCGESHVVRALLRGGVSAAVRDEKGRDAAEFAHANADIDVRDKILNILGSS